MRLTIRRVQYQAPRFVTLWVEREESLPSREVGMSRPNCAMGRQCFDIQLDTVPRSMKQYYNNTNRQLNNKFKRINLSKIHDIHPIIQLFQCWITWKVLPRGVETLNFRHIPYFANIPINSPFAYLGRPTNGPCLSPDKSNKSRVRISSIFSSKSSERWCFCFRTNSSFCIRDSTARSSRSFRYRLSFFDSDRL